MERLTERDAHGNWRIKRFTEILPAHWQACNRLAAIEDILGEEYTTLPASANWPRRTRSAFHRVHFAGSILRQVVMENRAVCARLWPHYGGSRNERVHREGDGP